MRHPAEAGHRDELPNPPGRGLGLVLVLIGIGIMVIAGGRGSLTTALLGGAVLMSGLMTRTDARRHLARRLAFAAVGMVLMGLYLLSR